MGKQRNAKSDRFRHKTLVKAWGEYEASILTIPLDTPGNYLAETPFALLDATTDEILDAAMGWDSKNLSLEQTKNAIFNLLIARNNMLSLVDLINEQIETDQLTCVEDHSDL